MQPKKFLKNLSLLLLLTISTGCSLLQSREEPTTIIEKQNIPIQSRPQAVTMLPVQFYVVTEDNFVEFSKEFKENYGDLVFFAITVPDYENMSLNLAELRRYILQQRNLIQYYENSIQPNNNNNE